MYPVLLGSETRQNHNLLISDNVKVLASACDGFNTDAMVIRNLIEVNLQLIDKSASFDSATFQSANIGDIGLLMQHVITTADHLQQQLKQTKRRVPLDPTAINLGVNKETAENLYQCYQHCGKVIKTLQDVVKTSVQAITATGDNEKGLSQDKIKDIANTASDKVYEQDDLGPIQSVKNSLAFVVTQITQLLQFLQDNEYDITVGGKSEEKVSFSN